MATKTYVPEETVPDESPDSIKDSSGIGGHPAGLTTLFFTEMWERFSYYGMRALLLLFMVASPANGGLGFPTAKAASIYGAYTGSVYLTSIPGGWVADKLLGARLTVLCGGVFIALGHFSMAVPTLPTFFSGLILIVIGTGLLKPNISTMVGMLYSQDDPRRDAGFSVYYMGINTGALIAPIVCGFLARRPEFKSIVGAFGLHPENTWHVGFAAAGLGMTFGIIQYLYPRAIRLLLISFGAFMGGLTLVLFKASVAQLASSSDIFWLLAAVLIGAIVGNEVTRYVTRGEKKRSAELRKHPLGAIGQRRQASKETEKVTVPKQPFTRDEKLRMAVVGILFLFATLFWMAFEQAGSSLNLFADTLTRHNVGSWQFDATYLQSVNSIFLILFAPVFSVLWIRLGSRQPSSPMKFAIGLLFVSLGFIVVAFASTLTKSGPVGPGWLILVYMLHTFGELSLSPVGLSTVTKLAPARVVGLMMGIWFLSISLGNYIAGWVAGNFDPKAEGALLKMFGGVALITLAAAAILAALAPSIRKMMGRVH
ncbi:MAG TPA: peptide MFS transporter [Blastocatellia bacterium]|nr:peptide MFS transporter [Blastocatellia bacterium]